MTVVWGAVCRPKQGQNVSGDVYLVHEFADGQLLVSVIDGLGGGEEAAKAAHAAEQDIMSHPDWALKELINHAHVALHGTRGAVIGLLRLDLTIHNASYVGVGNIGIQVYSQQPIKPISKNGILGFRLPTLLELHYTYHPGDLFILYSDGVSSKFGHDTQLNTHMPPQQLAEHLLTKYGKFTDDATVVAVQT